MTWKHAEPSCCRKACLVFKCATVRCILLASLGVAGTLLSLRWRGEIERPWGPTGTCEAYLGTRVQGQFSVILTADPGDFSGTPEAHYIIANLKDKKTKPRDTTVCGGHYQGMLMGQPVLVVTTGIGPPAAGLCTLEVVSACGPQIREILYFGTSGWSPQLGGVLNPPSCGAANKNQKTNRLGDVCVSPFTVNWTCKKSSWQQQAGGYPNQCYRPPEVSSPNATILYGECQFYKDNMEANLALADELLSVIRSKSVQDAVPKRAAAVTAIEQKYWRLMGEATGLSYPVPQPSSPPTVYDYTQCMEVDGQFFYSGVPFEVKSRDYAAETLTAALGVYKTSADVVAVSAMEGIGVAEALLKYHRLSTTKRAIPYTHVRTLSNWLHQPVKQVEPGVWVTGEEMPEDFVTGYGYAIATGSATLMSLYQRRCKQDVQLKRLPTTTDCTYAIDYDSTTDLTYPGQGKGKDVAYSGNPGSARAEEGKVKATSKDLNYPYWPSQATEAPVENALAHQGNQGDRELAAKPTLWQQLIQLVQPLTGANKGYKYPPYPAPKADDLTYPGYPGWPKQATEAPAESVLTYPGQAPTAKPTRWQQLQQLLKPRAQGSERKLRFRG